MNKTRFYEILQANKNGEDLSAFVPKNPAEAALLANLTGGSGGTGGTEYIDGITKTSLEVGLTGDIYLDINGATQEEINALIDELIANNKDKFAGDVLPKASLCKTTDGAYLVVDVTSKQIQLYYSSNMMYSPFYDYYGGFYGGITNSSQDVIVENVEQYAYTPLLINAKIEPGDSDPGRFIPTPVESELTNKLFYIGKKEVKLVANADITSEQLNGLNKVEVVTPTETKIFGGSTGGVMPDIAYNNPDLPNLYYGMNLEGKSTIKIDLAKYMTWREAYDGYAMHDSEVGYGSGSLSYEFSLLTINVCYVGTSSISTMQISLNGTVSGAGVKIGTYRAGSGSGTSYWKMLVDVDHDYGFTIRQWLTEKAGGVIEFNIDEQLALHTSNNSDKIVKSLTYITSTFGNSAFGGYNTIVDLNEHPIDWITIE